MAGNTFVLLHGAWHGGWCWRDVAALLRAQGHRVTAPTQTGLGERRHLLSGAITLETFVQDLVEHLEAEEVEDAILVGHSFGGMAISGAADRVPRQIRHLVYLDCLVLEDGQALFDVLPADVVAERRRLAREQGGGLFIPCPPVSAFGVAEDHPLADWMRRRLTPHPLGTFETPLHLRHPPGIGLPCTYVACTNPPYPPFEGARREMRGRAGWAWQEIATGHDAMVTAPEALARMLAAIA
jgi:pimeloyl-ACP methyl ester carboxylesterase